MRVLTPCPGLKRRLGVEEWFLNMEVWNGGLSKIPWIRFWVRVQLLLMLELTRFASFTLNAYVIFFGCLASLYLHVGTYLSVQKFESLAASVFIERLPEDKLNSTRVRKP